MQYETHTTTLNCSSPTEMRQFLSGTAWVRIRGAPHASHSPEDGAKMPTNTGTFEDGADTRGVTEKVTEAASQMKDKVSDLGRTAAKKIDENREGAATGLENAATTLHQKADSVAGLAHSTADRLSSTADYVRQHDVKSMTADVEQMVKNNPGPSLVAAAVVGFLLGRAFSNNG
jgi:ElaB/YqjD/DUF883 family membrane-anchored ribosome-binding protein